MILVDISGLKVVLPSAVLLFPCKCALRFPPCFCSIPLKLTSDPLGQMCQGGSRVCTEVVINLVLALRLPPSDPSWTSNNESRQICANTCANENKSVRSSCACLLAAAFRHLMLSLNLEQTSSASQLEAFPSFPGPSLKTAAFKVFPVSREASVQKQQLVFQENNVNMMFFTCSR